MTPYRILPDGNFRPALELIRLAFAGMEGRIDPPSSVHKLTEDGLRKAGVEGEVWAIGHPLAACVVFTPLKHALYIGRLAVDPTQKKHGHGRALLDLAEIRARILGFDMLELLVRIELTENHAFFKRMGFEQTAECKHPGYDRVTELKFARRVSA